MTTFETGKTYYTPSVCDSNCIFTIKVISRTEKTITFENWDGRIRRARVKVFPGDTQESIQPDRYSFAPIYRANRFQA